MTLESQSLALGSFSSDAEPAAAEKVSNVGVAVHLVAAGATKHAIKLSMLLSPVPVTSGDGGLSVHLSQWPAEIAKLIQNGVTVLLQPAKAAVGDSACRPTGPDGNGTKQLLAQPVSYQKAFLSKGNDANLEAVSGLWEACFTPSPHDRACWGDGWGALQGALQGSADNRSGGAQAAASPEILSIQQGDLAVGLEIMRAWELAASLAGVAGGTFNRDKLEMDLAAADTKAPVGCDNPLESRDQAKKALDQLNADESAAARTLLVQPPSANSTVPNPTAAANIGSTARAAMHETCSKSDPAALGPTALSTTTTAIGLIGNTPVELHHAMVIPLASHTYGTTLQSSQDQMGSLSQGPSDGQPLAPVASDTLIQMVSRRFYALQSGPVLSRIFGLTIDLELDWDKDEGEFLDALGYRTPQTQRSPAEGFVFLAVRFGKPTDPPQLPDPVLWTLAKFVPPGASLAAAETSFWPATRAELDRGPCDIALLTQSNGFLVTRAGWTDVLRERSPRYELSTLDVRNGTESQVHRNHERVEQKCPSAQPTSGETNPVASLLHPVQRQTLTTGGLTLIDRGRQATIAAALGACTGHAVRAAATGAVLLDADDLTVGFQLDIGVPEGAGHPDHYQWRSMMNRLVAYGTSGQEQAALQRIVTLLAGELGQQERMQLDATLMSPAVRRMSPTDNSSDAITEEVTVLWDGGPMAIDCSGGHQHKKTQAELPWGTSISLPSGANSDVKPPLLRFGRGYRIGLRAVYQGGRSPNMAEAQSCYGASGENGFAFPPAAASPHDRTAPVRRFLRHERINPPVLLIPEIVALKRNGVMGYERSQQAVIRSFVQDPERHDEEAGAQRAAPVATSRIFVPAEVAQAFAALHGMFDHETDQTPAGALPSIRHDAAQGGFPFVSAQARMGLDNEAYAAPPQVGTSSADNSDAVFASASSAEADGSKPYYPDPMSRFYRLALRFPGTAIYLPGAAINVACYPPVEPILYGNLLPLMVTIERTVARKGGKKLSQGDVLVFEKAATMHPSAGGSPVQVQHVRVLLAPGDDFELDVWTVPGADLLARNFAVIETLATLASYRQDDGPGTYSDILRPLAAILKGAPRTSSRWTGFIGVGGLVTPGPAQLRALAQDIDAAMMLAPVDEIAAAKALRVTHALNRPALPPVLIYGAWPPKWKDLPVFPLRIARLDPVSAKALRLKPPNDRFKTFFDVNGQSTICPNTSDYSLGGSLLIDLNTSDAFEIQATTVFPRATKFDDRNRGRSLRNRRSGLWPDEINPTSTTAMQLDVPRTLVSTRDVYGFDVAADGTVTLPRVPVTLMRVDNLKTPQAAGVTDQSLDLEVIQLEQLYGLFGSATTYQDTAGATADKTPSVPARLSQAKVSFLHQFPDGKARKLELRAVSLSRFAHAMIIPPERDPSTGMFRPGQPLNAENQLCRNVLPPPKPLPRPDVSVWLQATQRPAKPEIRSPIPAFVYDCPTCTPHGQRRQHRKSRRGLTRLLLQREWFSSGEGERLGIVIWPPNLFEACMGDPGAGIVEIEGYSGPSNGQPDKVLRRIDIPDFVDEDLGAGGAFVTRWGGDPIRVNDPRDSQGVLIPPQAFVDVAWQPTTPGCNTCPDGTAVHVPHLLMPVADAVRLADSTTGAESTDQAGAGGNAQPQTLSVALLTYVPRFDVSSEQWYVDVDIDSGNKADIFVRFGLVRYQPQAPADLQVSYPVVTWAQLLPRRDVVVDVQLNATDLAAIDHITVTITGPASTRLADVSFLAKLHERPVMTVELWFSTADANGVGSEILLRPARTIELTDMTEAAMWRTTFEDIKPPRADGRLYIFVEELELRRPASYENEPVGVGKNSPLDQEFKVSGPRFAMRVDL